MSGLLLAAFSGASLALVSSAHCAVMCGPLVVASSARMGGGGGRYFVGRLVAYTLLGALSGSAVRVLSTFGPGKWIEAALSWLLALTLLFSAVRYLTPRRAPSTVDLRKKPKISVVSRLLAASAQDPLLLGAVTALLPCGVLFTAVMAAAALGSAASGAVAMASFASFSGLALVSVSSVLRRLTHGIAGRRALAMGLLAGAALMVWRPIPTLRSEATVPACHAQPLGRH